LDPELPAPGHKALQVQTLVWPNQQPKG